MCTREAGKRALAESDDAVRMVLLNAYTVNPGYNACLGPQDIGLYTVLLLCETLFQ